jgi:dUTP pyrophosphatase
MDSSLVVSIKRIAGNNDLPLPEYRTLGAAGMDVRAAVVGTTLLQPGARLAVPTGFAIALPVGYEAQLRPRSGLALSHGITVFNAPGTIDSDYRGEVIVILANFGTTGFEIVRGMRIAQMVVSGVSRAKWNEVEELSPTPRGGGGLGHTGT